MSLADKALLATLHISQWTGRKHDKNATATVEATHETQRQVGNYTKKLLPGAKELAEIGRLSSGLRAFYYEQTLPWFNDGSRIISSKNYMDFVNAFRVKKGEFENAVAAFLNEYPTLRESARAKLGDLFREGEYPTVASLTHAFACEISFMPMPDVKDFRVEILDSEKDQFISKMQDIESNAMRECWTRLYDVVSKAAVTLEKPEAVFRDSLIENITDICALLPKLNVTDNPDLEAMRSKVQAIVSNISPEVCRKSIEQRTHAATQLDEISAKMSAFMGV